MHVGPSISRMRPAILLCAELLLLSGRLEAAVRVSPPAVVLASPEGSEQLLVSDLQADGRTIDLTRSVTYKVVAPPVVRVDPAGMIYPLAEGKTEIIIRQGTAQARVPVEVRDIANPQPIAFEQQVVPILTKAGCNSGGCHGKAEGQNGFKLSVFGSNAAADHDALVSEARGRRIFLTDPANSLLLRKADAELPHGGGRRIDKGDRRYQRLLRWIVEGAAFSGDAGREVVSIGVEPQQQILAPNGMQQLRVTAVERSGRRYCVTAEAEYDSNAKTIATVDRQGLVRADAIPGEAAILVRYLGRVAVCRITIPRSGVQFVRPPENNFVDRLVWDKLQLLGIPPSGLADDATFLRRVYLDTIGTLPTAAEARDFLADADPNKRPKLIDQLLAREEYADFWTLRWLDLLRVDKDRVTPQGAVAMARWLRRQFSEDRPYDAFARDVLTVVGPTQAEGPGSFYKVLDTPEVVARSISQLFLGVRIECAQCHHHPSERWGQDDYYGLAGFFTGVVRKTLPSGRMALFPQGGTDLKHPRTGELVPTHALGAPPADLTRVSDRRIALADWMTASDNPFFATAISNRLWAHYFGRGLVEPIDDLRATNPATNEPLLAALAAHIREVKFDLKAFTRTLLTSRAYQLESQGNEANAGDEQNFSHAAHKALPAEVLLDALCEVTGVPEKFNGWPEGYRAIQIWDNRMPSYFFRIFGRPVRSSVCECERSNEPSISQALHLMNSHEVMEKIRARTGRARQLADSGMEPAAIIDELYLAALARHPRDDERGLLLNAFAREEGGRRAAVEDVLWTLLNTKEFLYNH
ncbi:MAG: DUF1549 domain-containing protein [Deltaproteobacteria bacterium]